MALQIDHFEKAVEPVIVQRGRKCFRLGAVRECTEENGEITAYVQGMRSIGYGWK
jgi:uncharacterized Zn finger protein